MRYQYLHLLLDEPDAEAYREGLREKGSDAGSLHAKSQNQDEENIEEDVDNRGGDEEVEWLLRVAEGTDLSCQQVVAYRERYRRKLEHEEDVGIIEYLQWGVDEMQNLLAEKARQEGDDHGEGDGYAIAVAHVGSHFSEVLRPESLSHWDGEAGARTIAEAHDQEHDGGGGANGCQGIHADPSSHDDGVDDEIHLLQDIAQDKGYCESEDGSHRRTNSHVIYVITAHILYIPIENVCSFYLVFLFGLQNYIKLMEKETSER